MILQRTNISFVIVCSFERLYIYIYTIDQCAYKHNKNVRFTNKPPFKKYYINLYYAHKIYDA